MSENELQTKDYSQLMNANLEDDKILKIYQNELKKQQILKALRYNQVSNQLVDKLVENSEFLSYKEMINLVNVLETSASKNATLIKEKEEDKPSLSITNQSINIGTSNNIPEVTDEERQHILDFLEKLSDSNYNYNMLDNNSELENVVEVEEVNEESEEVND